jgi:tRNA G10  N-methylase Trm11
MIKNNKNKYFGLLCFAGLGNLAIKELSICNAEDIKKYNLPNYDLIIFSIPDNTKVEYLNKLGIAEDIFYMINREFKINSKKDLHILRRSISKEQIFEGINIKNQLNPKNKRINNVSIFSFVKQDKDRDIHRKEIAEVLIQGVLNHFPKWKVKDPASIELWGFYLNESLYTGLRLSTDKMRYHNKTPSMREGTLRPTIAYAMIYAASPKDNEIIVDPMCGSGTIISEGILYNNNAKYIGGDRDPKAISIAKSRIDYHKNNVELQIWDAKKLPFKEKEIDLIVTNLPYGKQFSSESRNHKLYDELLNHWNSLLKESGKMLLLTADNKSIENNLNKHKFGWYINFKVKVLGLWAKAYMVFKN